LVALRILAAVAGALIGWLTTGYLVRLLVRLAFRRATPRPVVFLSRLVGAAVLGLLVYYYLHPGGSGGWGLGGGGSGVGKNGTGSTGVQKTAKASTTKATTPRATEKTPAADVLTIAMLGGSRYKGEQRYYLVDGKQPARTLVEVKEYLKTNKGRYRRLEIVIYPDSVAREHQATTRLEELAQREGLLLSVSRATRTPPLN
jgi:hypothetical protein